MTDQFDEIVDSNYEHVKPVGDDGEIDPLKMHRYEDLIDPNKLYRTPINEIKKSIPVKPTFTDGLVCLFLLIFSAGLCIWGGWDLTWNTLGVVARLVGGLVGFSVLASFSKKFAEVKK